MIGGQSGIGVPEAGELVLGVRNEIGCTSVRVSRRWPELRRQRSSGTRGVMVRNNADEGYDYRVRTLDFANLDTPLRRVPGTCRRAG